MFLILKIILIILLNETYAYITQNSEIILLPAWNPTDTKEISLTLKAFGKQIHLNLRRNDQIMSAFKVWKHNVKIITEKLSQLNAPDSCYYFHEDHISTAAINFCQEHGLEGIVFLENTTLDISPLRNNLATSSSIGDSCVETETNVSFGKPHLIKHLPDSDLFHINNRKPRQHRSPNMIKRQLNLELAVFLDDTAYYRLLPLHDGNQIKIRDMLQAYVNGLEAVLQHPSLGVSINILLRYMEIMQIQPEDVPRHNGHATSLLHSFCEYANRILHANSEKYHWDVALYLTGLDIFNDMDHKSQGFAAINTTLIRGWARVNDLCTSYSCAIVEFGTRVHEYSIPTTGFGSIYSAAQEIGHLFGMTFDGVPNSSCLKGEHIMSFTWKENDFHKTTWSNCSREIAMELHKTKDCLLDGETAIHYEYRYIDSTPIEQIKSTTYYNTQKDHLKKEWDAKRQCELFLRDKKANIVTMDNVCQFLQCEGPDKRSFFMKYNYLNHEYEIDFDNYFAGPALDGTRCAYRKECHHGTCSPIESSKISNCSKDDTCQWKEESCKKNCLEKSKGVIIKRRICQDTNGPPNCEGSSYDVQLCDDSNLCSERPRLPIDIYMQQNCEQFGFLRKGVQMPHIFSRPWIACTIYCRKEQEDSDKDVSPYYAPIEELSNSIRSYPYLPDGTWCHTDTETGQDYFCRKHQCLLESTRLVNCRKTLY